VCDSNVLGFGTNVTTENGYRRERLLCNI